MKKGTLSNRDSFLEKCVRRNKESNDDRLNRFLGKRDSRRKGKLVLGVSLRHIFRKKSLSLPLHVRPETLKARATEQQGQVCLSVNGGRVIYVNSVVPPTGQVLRRDLLPRHTWRPIHSPYDSLSPSTIADKCNNDQRVVSTPR